MAEAIALREKHHTSSLKQVIWAWTSAADGSVGAVAGKTTRFAYTGPLTHVLIVPGLAGDAPSDLFNVTVKDSDGNDLLVGYGAKLSNVNNTLINGNTLAVVNDTLTLAVTGAGSGNMGEVFVYIGE